MSFVNQSTKESLNSVVDSSVILKSEFRNSINNARDNILKRKGLFPPIETSAELKKLGPFFLNFCIDFAIFYITY